MQTTIQYIKNELKDVYPESEVQGLTRIVLEHITGWNYTQQQLNQQKKIPESAKQEIVTIVERLKNYEPVQYILGETEFFGMKLKLSPEVLIPRPETEELVKLVLDRNTNRRPRILDIGTGSGCIALALKYHLKEAQVSGVDVSEMALEIAKENAKLNQLEVEYFYADILWWEDFKWGHYDIIVSNPPYVRESEKIQMQKNVIAYEPHNALFVSDNDPLIFYRKIITFAIKYLSKNGSLFFEINENLGKEMYELFNALGFRKIEALNDINGKRRMICGIK